ncbi:MAG: hypothetical protein ACI4PR_03515 [Acutalibacteraceae bacterium]
MGNGDNRNVLMGIGSLMFFVLTLDKFVKSCGDMKSVVSDFSSGVKNLVSKYL